VVGGAYDSVRASALAAASRLYNRLLGLVTSVSILRPDVLDLSIYSAHSQHSPVHALVPDVMVKAGPQVELVPGGGKGITQLDAVLGALEVTECLSAILDATEVLDQLRLGVQGC
jgi:ribosomal protein S12 methylthiotransferase accessory factor